MDTYYIRVSVGRVRVVKVEADSRHEAEAAASELLTDDLEGYPVAADDVLAETVTEDDYSDDDSIIAIPHYRGDLSWVSYEFAPDDPAGRGA